MAENEKALANQQNNALANQGTAMGFDEDSNGDVIIPRIKVINALSPERIDGIAEEGALLNSLTQESLIGQRFIPFKQYYSNIHWNPDRDGDPRIFCRSQDGRIGQNDMGACSCSMCGKNKFDNTKTGKDAQPVCTQYLNFLGFIEGSPMPIVLSFARTNYAEGRKLLSMAKSMRQPLWNFAYVLSTKQISKDRNRWYIIVTQMAGETSPEERAIAAELFSVYQSAVVNADLEDSRANNAASPETDADTEAEL